MNLLSHIPAAKDDIRFIQRKCGVNLVHLTEGCGKTRLEINDTIPHTRIDMGYQGTEYALPHVSIRK